MLTTERLRFRAWNETDVDLAAGLWGAPEVARFISRDGTFDAAAVRERLLREMALQDAHGVQYWPIFSRQDDAHVGCCGLHPYGTEAGVYELGVHLRPAYWRKGLAVEAASAVIAHAFDALGARTLFAGHHPANTGSKQMLLRLGFRYTHDELYPPTGLMHPSYTLEAQ
ncbi:MAG: GNAT family N-acetyltransferase [Polyangiaceae bacterium]|nr:GNAT family N-acetyltransferase [Polyangiaceae bacterium]